MEERQPPTKPQPEALQILATEHWSLLATRSLIYQESFGRVNMFLAILSGVMIALALVAQATSFSTSFYAVAIFMLAVVFFVGVATVRRLLMLNRDDYVTVIGMNRLRHGYLDAHPELEPNFTTSSYDDLPGALRTLGIEPTRRGVGSFFHRSVTLPGMVGVIVAAVGGAIGGLAAVAFSGPAYAVILVGGAVFAATELLIMRTGRHSFRAYGPGLKSRFPTPN